ncbi:hypothetical protein [Natranaerobius thermophilus]|uniref:Uncharacterized protein n=1 Tax=Natranaerobius thermophilus (strain ATCC BAA-1301 / DSM 18059 / JW/NM-WN-LF) TaxID=457570 RepID=B2A3Z1_NATTJ|nr:hypothetical protein [Natranaerobius thermophilus]ACB85093.1 hypothetical protein Nther_1512 [Natranaerobius thermophilus JW/NM-WN-LF]
MKEVGLEFSTEEHEKDKLIIKYLNYLRKIEIQEAKYIYKSKEFYCPPEHEKGLEKLIDTIEKERDISPYLSTRAKQLKDDGMFNDWGVLHLHLGNNLDNRGYIERTGPILFAYYNNQEKAAYLINIYEHGNWAKKDVLQIMYDNWPWVLDPFKLNGVSAVTPDFEEDEHLKLRKSGGNILINLQDEKGNLLPIAPPGWGITTAGTSVADVMIYQKLVQEIQDLEKLVKENTEKIIKQMRQQGVIAPEGPNFKLVKISGKWYVKEVNTNCALNLKIIDPMQKELN